MIVLDASVVVELLMNGPMADILEGQLNRLLKKSFVSLLVETKARLYVLANYARN